MVNVYYAADVRSVLARTPVVPDTVQVRAITESDVPVLAEVYRRAYGADAMTPDEALAEMHAAFDGTWGALWPDASPGAWVGNQLVTVVQTVRRPSWADAPNCPWLIEVFTDPQHRRAGFARALIRVVCRVLAESGEQRIGLTVDDANTAAVALYRSLGFIPSR